MAETVNQANTQNEPQTPRTFTQEELDAIVGDRLARERAKYSDYEALKEKAAQYDAAKEAEKTELQKATETAAALQAELDTMKAAESARVMREKVSKETGVPASLLTGTTEDDCKAQAKDILAFAKPTQYPSVRDGGETTVSGKRTTAQMFEEYAAQQI